MDMCVVLNGPVSSGAVQDPADRTSVHKRQQVSEHSRAGCPGGEDRNPQGRGCGWGRPVTPGTAHAEASAERSASGRDRPADVLLVHHAECPAAARTVFGWGPAAACSALCRQPGWHRELSSAAVREAWLLGADTARAEAGEPQPRKRHPLA